MLKFEQVKFQVAKRNNHSLNEYQFCLNISLVYSDKIFNNIGCTPVFRFIVGAGFNASADNWWLRSPNSSNSNNARNVNNNGNINNNNVYGAWCGVRADIP